MNALTNTYEQHLTFNEPQHSCTSCHINFPTINDLEDHSLIHESYYNPLLGHSYTEEPNHCNYSFTYFNVCGLSSKLFFDDFKETLIKHDIISLCETKLDDADNDYIIEEFKELGFGVFIKNRKNLIIWRSGGVLVAIKTPLCKFVSKVECNHDFMVVLILDKRLFKFDKNILFITAYVPPYKTRYSSIDLFSKISNIILNYDPEDYYHLVVGDFNAHTGVESDIVTFDDNIIRTLDLDNDIIARLEINHYMDLLDIPIDRSSVDQMADRGNYGEALLDICRNNLLCNFKGRVGEDRHVGKATSTDSSLIDYVIFVYIWTNF